MAVSGALARFSLSGKSALITGASSGFGAQFTKTLAASGADSVVVAARRVERLQGLAEEVRAAHPNCEVVPVPMDVNSTESVKVAFDLAQAKLGKPCDVVINNAGIVRVCTLCDGSLHTIVIKCMAQLHAG